MSAGRPPVAWRVTVARPACAREARAWSMAMAGWFLAKRSRIWVRERPDGLATNAAWICSATGSPLEVPSAQAAERAE